MHHSPITFTNRTLLLLASAAAAATLGACGGSGSSASSGGTLKLAMTGVALWSGLAWFIFYGVMSRY